MKKAIFLLVILHLSYFTFGQTTDSTQTPRFFTGVITATNNGISLLPNFSLNKPAVLFDLSIGKGRLSFDPMFRFAMDGKPWSFIFWWRYKVVTNKRFTMSIGAHPSFVFRTMITTSNGVTNDYLTAQRYFAWEITPTYFINKKVGLGIYYLGSHGLDKNITRYTHFVAFRGILSNLALSKQFNLTLIPQFYYLKLDKIDGTYVNATVTLAKKNFPLSISSIVSKAIKTEVAGKDFVWNVALNYHINNRYNKVK